MAKSAKDMVKEAKARIDNLDTQQVKEELDKGATLIDIRDKEEIEAEGKIPGSVHASRGMLEFYADETHSYHKPEFDRNKKIILHCAAGGRSALAAATLKDMGYTDVGHLEGGFKAWKEAGLPVEKNDNQ